MKQVYKIWVRQSQKSELEVQLRRLNIQITDGPPRYMLATLPVAYDVIMEDVDELALKLSIDGVLILNRKDDATPYRTYIMQKLRDLYED